MTDVKALGAQAIRAIDDRRAALIKLSLSLHGEPEIAYQERKSAAKLAEFLELNGFSVQRKYKDLETSYRGDAAGKTGKDGKDGKAGKEKAGKKESPPARAESEES